MRSLLAFFALLVLVFSAFGFRREYPGVILLNESPSEQIARLRQLDDLPLPPSARTLGEVLTECSLLVLAAARGEIDPESRADLQAACRRLAERIEARSPAHAQARALRLLLTPAAALRKEQYHLARMTAPFEPWPLQLRLSAAAALPPEIFTAEPGLGEEFHADVDMVQQTPWGRNILASLWAHQPHLRPMIQHSLEERPAAEQRAFLSLVRTYMR